METLRDLDLSPLTRRVWRGTSVGILLLCSVLRIVAAPVKPGDLEFFEKHVRPILVDQCYECHSAGKQAKGGLLLDSRAAVLRGGDHGPSLVVGEPAKSRLIEAVRYQKDDLQMPPKHRLRSEEVKVLEEWIRRGAPDPREEIGVAPVAKYQVDFNVAKNFWSFQSLRAPIVPSSKSRSLNPIDHFIAAKLEEKDLQPAPPADKLTLIRRVTFDLIGLPPAPEEVRAFLADQSPVAFARVIERLLASPQYGERWGRHWLDVVRYADTAGDSSDFPIPQAYKYRNYVLDSFNADKPYDRFLKEQIAGDLLPFTNELERRDNIVATGFIASARRFGVSDERHLTIEDTIDVVGKAMLGLTVSCARCHDHKFDPISTRDYYALYGIFNSTRYPFPGSETDKHQRDFVPLVPQVDTDALLFPFTVGLAQLDARIKALTLEKAALTSKPGDAALNPGRIQEIDSELQKANREREAVMDDMPIPDNAYAVTEGTPKDAHLQRRGEPNNLGEAVPRGFLQVLGGQRLPENFPGSGRLQLAEWIASPANPLTARVMVNRIWQHHFGKGLVATPNDFGKQGRAPTHPELLDFLASQFIQQGWSIKAMHRIILMSETYQRSSNANRRALIYSPRHAAQWGIRAAGASPAEVDPGNDLLWRFNRQRLDAEIIRDTLLEVAGQLDPNMGVAHPFPPESRWSYSQHNAFTATYDHRQRSVYLMQQRIRKHPFFATFDGADANASTGSRLVSTTPLQALFMMNDVFVEQMAIYLSARLMQESGEDRARIERAHWLAFSRPATKSEVRDGLEFLKNFRLKGKAAGIAEGQLDLKAWAGYVQAVLGSNEFICVD